MNLHLRRTDFRPDGIFGELFQDDGSHLCYTLERSYPLPDDGSKFGPKIPSGVFTCKRGQHQLAHMTKPFTTFEVTNVPGHTNILFHTGNYNRDSEGCILVGTTINQQSVAWMITASAPMFNKFMQLQSKVNEFTLTVEE